MKRATVKYSSGSNFQLEDESESSEDSHGGNEGGYNNFIKIEGRGDSVVIAFESRDLFETWKTCLIGSKKGLRSSNCSQLRIQSKFSLFGGSIMSDNEKRTAKEAINNLYNTKEWHMMENKNGVLVFSDRRGVNLSKVSLENVIDSS